MARGSLFKGSIKKAMNISFGIVTVFFLLWLIFHTSQYVPEGREDFWLIIFLSYGILLSLVFGNADLRNKLFDIRFIDSVPRLLMYFFFGLIFFYFLLSFVDPLEGSLFGILSAIPLWLAAIHAFVFATIESVVWQGYLDYKVGLIASPLIAGIFHYGVWTGGAFLVIFSAGLLFLFFSTVNWYFRVNKNDVIPAIGVHTAYNFIKLGILLSVV